MAVRELQSPPSMAALFARAGVGAIPGMSMLPFLPSRAKQVPDVTLKLAGVTVDRDRLAAYDRVCGFTLGNTLPPTYPHMLAFPLQLALMTDGKFPFPAMGLVHIGNEITQHRPIKLGEKLDIKVTSTKLAPHPRGKQFSLRTEVRSGRELVWESSSTNLRRVGAGKSENGKAAKGRAKQPESLRSAADLPVSATWKLSGDLGRRYGWVSGDMNPIHIHPLTARPFGFPAAIAHGMWTKARCLAALSSELPDAYTVRVEFRKPIVLPARVTFAEEASEGGIDFGVRPARKGAPQLDGRITFA